MAVEAELNGGREILQDAAPIAFVVRPAAVALVDDDEVEKILRVFAKVGRAVGAGHEGLEDREKQAAVLRHLALFADVFGIDPHQRILGKSREGVEGLVGQNVSIREKKDARPAGWFAREIPARVEELPRDLEGNEGFARSGGEREQDALFVLGDGREDALDGDVLVIAARMRAAFVLIGHLGKAVAPRVRLGEGFCPEFLRRGKRRDLTLRAGLHVDAVDARAVGRVGEAHRELASVVFCLPDSLGEGFGNCLGFDSGELCAPKFEDIVRLERLAASAAPLDAAGADEVFAPDAGAFNHAPTCGSECGIDEFGSGFGFVHDWALRRAVRTR